MRVKKANDVPVLQNCFGIADSLKGSPRTPTPLDNALGVTVPLNASLISELRLGLALQKQADRTYILPKAGSLIFLKEYESQLPE